MPYLAIKTADNGLVPVAGLEKSAFTIPFDYLCGLGNWTNPSWTGWTRHLIH